MSKPQNTNWHFILSNIGKCITWILTSTMLILTIATIIIYDLGGFE